MKWQPIETAPKDDVILLTDGGCCFTGFWQRGGWISGICNEAITVTIDIKATHWMPLPSPPMPRKRRTINLDTNQIGRELAEESAPDKTHNWRFTSGVFSKSVRFNVSLLDVNQMVKDLRLMATELPKIADQIESQDSELDKQVMAESLIRILRNKIKRD